ncbi:Hydroxyisourate hydrolase, partial [Cylindrobasidium torrendii FP15055 ss-10]
TMMSPITCHILDSSAGRPVPDVKIQLQRLSNEFGTFQPVSEGVTNADGRCLDLLSNASADIKFTPGPYKIIFRVKEYFEKKNQKCFYPWVERAMHTLTTPCTQITFEVENTDEHYHIPLLISPYSFTTYRGS